MFIYTDRNNYVDDDDDDDYYRRRERSNQRDYGHSRRYLRGIKLNTANTNQYFLFNKDEGVVQDPDHVKSTGTTTKTHRGLHQIGMYLLGFLKIYIS